MVRRLSALMVMVAVVGTALTTGPGDADGVSSRGQYLAGQLLVAAPKMGDPRFAETVIYMIDHDAQGALGVVVNRVYGEGPLQALLGILGVETERASGSVRLHYGGPVEPSRGFVLHSADYNGPSTLSARGTFAVSSGLDVLKAIANGSGPSRKIMIMGYAGWGPGQLEGELARDDWFTAPAEESLIFADELESVWDRAMARAGVAL